MAFGPNLMPEGRALPEKDDESLRLGRVAACLADSFQFQAPDCPGLAFVGELADPGLIGLTGKSVRLSVAGSGLTPADAETRCLGEAAERISCLAAVHQPGEPVALAEIPDDLRALLGDVSGPVPCLQGQRLSDGDAVWVPVNLCLHDPAAGPPPVARGTAAGSTWPAAVKRAVAEVVERDAAALWWLGGRHAPPVSLEAASTASDVLTALRGRADTRTTWLLDLGREFGISTFAAVSVLPSGEGFACGLRAAPAVADAIRSALIEMAQMELSQHLIRGKAKALGSDALTPADRRQIERSVRITPENCPLIVPVGGPRPSGRGPISSPGETIQSLCEVSNLYSVDLTRPSLDIPVAAILAPRLQPLDPASSTPRLRAACEQTGGGDQYHGGQSLL